MGIKTLRRYNNIKTARVQINIKGYNDANKKIKGDFYRIRSFYLLYRKGPY